MLLIHGWPLNHTSYHALLPHLTPRFTCHLPDTPGLGDSEWSAGTDFSFPGQAQTLRGVADALGLSEYGVIAHDTGASIARLLAATDARVRKLVLLNTEMPGHRPPWIPLYRNLAALPGTATSFRLLLRSRLFLRSPMGFGGCFHDLDRIDAGFVARNITPLLGSPRRLEGILRYLRGIDWQVVDSLRAIHAGLDIPVLLVWGAQDPTFPVAAARQMVQQFRHCAGLVEIPAARLLVHEERAQQVAAAALQFLTGSEWTG